MGDDAYLGVNEPHTSVYRIGKDGRVEDLGDIDDAINGFAWVHDHLEVVTGRTFPVIHARQGNEWRRRPIAYRDNEVVGRSLEVAIREPTG